MERFKWVVMQWPGRKTENLYPAAILFSFLVLGFFSGHNGKKGVGWNGENVSGDGGRRTERMEGGRGKRTMSPPDENVEEMISQCI